LPALFFLSLLLTPLLILDVPLLSRLPLIFPARHRPIERNGGLFHPGLLSEMERVEVRVRSLPEPFLLIFDPRLDRDIGEWH
jgi:hypothetical protein